MLHFISRDVTPQPWFLLGFWTLPQSKQQSKMSEKQCEWELGGIRECGSDIQESTTCFAKPDLVGK